MIKYFEIAFIRSGVIKFCMQAEYLQILENQDTVVIAVNYSQTRLW